MEICKGAKIKVISLLGLDLTYFSYNEFSEKLSIVMAEKKRFLVTYLNAHCSNVADSDLEYANSLRKFDVIHPDGIGVWFALHLMHGWKKDLHRITGSDLYETMISYSKKFNWRIYFFGDTEETLSRISLHNPDLVIAGYSSGYEFSTQVVIESIRDANPDILIVGLGVPGQEKWVADNFEKLPKIPVFCIGDGIKVFSGTKRRGPVFFRKMGLEWVSRLFAEPFRLFKRYFFGIPFFIYRIFKAKFYGI